MGCIEFCKKTHREELKKKVLESIIHKHVLLKFENLSNKRILILSEESGTRIWCIFTIFFRKLHRLVIPKMYLKIPFKVTDPPLTYSIEENENKNRHGKREEIACIEKILASSGGASEVDFVLPSFSPKTQSGFFCKYYWALQFFNYYIF